MVALNCEICGGTLVAQAGGMFVCNTCGVEYSKERVQELFQSVNCWEYAENADGSLTLLAYTGADPDLKELNIPDSIDGKPVRALGKKLCYEFKKLQKVVLPEGLQKLGDAAFCICNSLTEINFPASIQEIAPDCFNECLGFEELELPATIKSIRRGAFLNCRNLRQIELPPDITQLEMMTFSGCRSLESIKLPEGVKAIGDSVFCDCGSLRQVVLPEGLEKIGMMTFLSCKSLAEVFVPASVNSIGELAFPAATVIHGVSGSYAEEWARKHGLQFVAV